MAYKCPECGAIFEEPVYETVCFEEIYGVGSMFADRHYGTFTNCPECGMPIDTEYDIYDEEYDGEEEDESDEQKKYGTPGGDTTLSGTN